MTEDDELWSETTRESIVDLEQRIVQFLNMLCQRQENYIVVVSHGVWIETMLHRYDPTTLSNGQRVYNCNAFATQCVSMSSSTINNNNDQENHNNNHIMGSQFSLFLRLQNTHLI